MSLFLISIVTFCYFITGCLQAFQGNVGFSIMWFSYAAANIGLALAGATE